MRFSLVLLLVLSSATSSADEPKKAPASVPVVKRGGGQVRDNPPTPKEYICQGTYRKDETSEEILQVTCGTNVNTKCKCEETKISCSSSQDADSGYKFVKGTCKVQ